MSHSSRYIRSTKTWAPDTTFALSARGRAEVFSHGSSGVQLDEDRSLPPQTGQQLTKTRIHSVIHVNLQSQAKFQPHRSKFGGEPSSGVLGWKAFYNTTSFSPCGPPEMDGFF